MKKKNVKVNEDELFELLEDQKVELRDVREIGEESYLEYSMAVIVARALPDARDGLKPVHRRILFAMHDLGVTYKSSYKKSARIVGDVIGKYHPHGDSSVYEAMVRMAQPFAMRIQLIDGQGNFGSIDGDSAAAMRYTEARMGSIPSTFCFKDLDPSIVDFNPNYDGSESEPSVLPIKYPNLLVNGIHGIAVGMASEIAPHNPIEVMKAVEYKVENRITGTADNIDDLVRIIPAPDFPTGGYAHGTINMKEVWERGTGKIHLRGVWDIEEEYGKTFVNIKEIPYQVNKFKLVEAMKALVKPHPETKLAKIEGVSNIEDYSDKEGIFIQVVIKNEYDAEMIMNELLAQTQLQETFNYNATVLIKENGRLIPKRLGLNELLDQFIDFRLDVIERRTHLADGKLAARQHVLEALRKAIDPDMIEKVISTIRANKDSQSAKDALMNLLDIDEGQADQVLQIRLNRLTGLEVDKIDDEIGEIESTRTYYKTILADDKVRLGIILEESEDVITEFSRIKNVKPCDYKGVKYCLQERLTEFQQDVVRTDLAATTKEEECNIIVSAEGFIRRVPMSELTTMNRGARGRKQIELGKTDFVNLSIQSHSHDALLFITDKGQCYAKNAYDIPDKKSGLHVNRLLSLSDKGTEKIVDIVTVNFEKEDQLVAMFTKGGLVKISKLSAYMSASRKGGIKAVTLRENDEILSAALCKEEDQIFMVNSASKIIRFDVNTVNVVGRTASGVMGMKLDKDVNVVGASVIKGDSGYIVCVSEKGLIKVTEENQYRTQSRNGKGLFVMKESARSGQLFNAFFVSDLEEEDVVFTTKKGYSNRSALSTFKATNRNTSGVMLTKLEEDDCLVDIFHAPHQEMEEELDMDLTMDEVVELDSETEETTSED